MAAATWVLRYLKVSLGKCLLFRKTSNWDIKAFTVAVQVGSVIDRRPTSGYYLFV